MYGNLTYQKQSFIQWMKIMGLSICIRMTISKLRPPWRVHSNCKITTGRQRGISPMAESHTRHYQIGRSEAARDTSC